MSARPAGWAAYEAMCARHRWVVPPRYNIARDVCDRHARSHPAMVWEDGTGTRREVDFGELRDLSNRIAWTLAEHGVERGDRVATLLPQRPETAAAFLAVFRRGAILLSLSVLYGDESILHRLSDSGAKAVIVDAAERHRIPDGLAEVVLVSGGRAESRDVDLDAAILRASGRDATVDTAAGEPAQLYYSSGTTGKPKGILHAHRYMLGHNELAVCHELRDGELFHGSGEWAWAAGICPLLGGWRHGAVALVQARGAGYDPERHLDFLSRNGVENMFTTPTALRAMAAVTRAGARHPLGRLRIACSAGEPLNPEAIRWFREQYGVTVLDYYGLTESYPLCGNYPAVEVREGSMGLPLPGWEVALLDADEQPVPAGERGEICLRARTNPQYPLGYWDRPAETEEVFGGRWFHTKDAARVDEDGYYWYLGRSDDVIISAGYRIGPFEVESACVEHPAVLEAAAVASPDERRGDVVKAFVVLAEGHEPSEALAEEIRRHVRARHSAYAYPRRIEFVDDLPKTLTGKIRRRELRERERERAGTGTAA